MQKTQSPLLRLWQLGREHHGGLIAAIFCAVAGVLLGLLPYLSAGRILVALLTGQRDCNFYLLWCMVALGGYLAKTLLYNLALSLSHKATFQILRDIRKMVLSKMPRLPLGDILDTSSGRLKQIVVDQVESMETTLAHLLPEMTSNLLAPVCVLVYLFTLDWRMALLSLVSIPRDTLVFCEYSVPKINSAYGWAGGGESGMKELMQRVTEIIGFEPDGYVLIDLAGFEKLIDCMGGVEFNVPMDMQYSDPTQGLQIDLKAGEQKLNGDEAMQLVRFRSGYAMADLDRVSVQRAFVSAALSQWLTPGKLVRLPGALKTLSQYTDSNLTAENYLWLAEAAAVCDMTDIRMQTLPGTATNLGGGSYYVLDAAGVAETVNACCNPYEQGIAVSDLSIRVG